MNDDPVSGKLIKKTDFILVGVGGQGTLLASNLIAQLGVNIHFDVKKAEIHGMSQRGGSVISHVRWAEKVFSPIIPEGSADFYISFEQTEAVRSIGYLSPSGQAIINDHQILPITVSSGMGDYPSMDDINNTLMGHCLNIHWVNASQMAKDMGNQRVANLVLMGKLSMLMDIPISSWEESMSIVIPEKYLEINRMAFHQGRGIGDNGTKPLNSKY